jgi:RNA polymerase sigma-70 factor (ECF subfamily)
MARWPGNGDFANMAANLQLCPAPAAAGSGGNASGRAVTLIENVPDETLVAALARRDQRALAELVARHGGWAARFAERMTGSPQTAEEVVQSAFLRLWNSAERWEGRSRFTTWFYRVLHNLAVDELRRRGTRLDRRSWIRLPRPGTAGTGSGARVRAALEHRPERARGLVLRHYEDCSRARRRILGIRARWNPCSRVDAALRRQLRGELLGGRHGHPFHRTGLTHGATRGAGPARSRCTAPPPRAWRTGNPSASMPSSTAGSRAPMTPGVAHRAGGDRRLAGMRGRARGTEPPRAGSRPALDRFVASALFGFVLGFTQASTNSDTGLYRLLGSNTVMEEFLSVIELNARQCWARYSRSRWQATCSRRHPAGRLGGAMHHRCRRDFGDAAFACRSAGGDARAHAPQCATGARAPRAQTRAVRRSPPDNPTPDRALLENTKAELRARSAAMRKRCTRASSIPRWRWRGGAGKCWKPCSSKAIAAGAGGSTTCDAAVGVRAPTDRCLPTAPPPAPTVCPGTRAADPQVATRPAE